MTYNLFDETVLTSRQEEVYEHYIQGESPSEIADTLGCSESTVESHISDINRRVEHAKNTVDEGKLPKESPLTLVSDGIADPLTLAYIREQIDGGNSVIVFGEESREVSFAIGLLLGEQVAVNRDDVWFKSPERQVFPDERIAKGVDRPVVRSMWEVDETDYQTLLENQAVFDVGDRGDVRSVIRSFEVATDATALTGLDDAVFIEVDNGSIRAVSKITEVTPTGTSYKNEIIYTDEGDIATEIDTEEYSELMEIIEGNSGAGYSAYWSIANELSW